jgi:DNA-binding transcriptional ArsR family regulator
MMQEETRLPQPPSGEIELAAVLRALAAPVRLEIARQLRQRGEATCSALDLPVKVSTVSHHLTEMRQAGLISTRIAGVARPSRLRVDDLESRFPGLLSAVLDAAESAGEVTTATRAPLR